MTQQNDDVTQEIEVPQPKAKRPYRRSIIKESPAEAEATVTAKQLLEFMAKMNEDNQNKFIEAIKELKKPTLLEQQKLDKDAAALEAKTRARILNAKREQDARDNLMRNCTHVRWNPATGVSKHLWVGHIHSPDGEKPYSLPTCLDCRTQAPKIYCNPNQIAGGMQLHEIPMLTLDHLIAAAIASGNDEAKTFKKDHNLLAKAS